MEEAKSKLLIVEDDLDIADMLNAYFKVQGYDVFTVNWGEDGVRTCLENCPDLMILDIRLPDIDGFEVARRLRANRRTQEVPIIFLTEKRDRADRLQGLELGVDDYITKPFDVQELRIRVNNVLQRAKQNTLTNPVTGLPEGRLVDEHLAEGIKRPDWAILTFSVEKLESFRESYGFVASDDVLRAISLMTQNIIKDIGSVDDFLGQVGPANFIIMTKLASLPALQERIRTRLEQSLDYFYPIKDREQSINRNHHLSVRFGELKGSEGQFASLEQLKDALLRK
jgi:PleD family two-component response regulator